MTGYQRHKNLEDHPTTFDAPQSGPGPIDIVEECSTCGQRWLHVHRLEYPLTLPSRSEVDQQSRDFALLWRG